MEHPIRTPSQLTSVLRSIRNERGLTQGDAAARVGLRQKTVSLIETDPLRSSVGSLFRLLSALDLELVVRPKSADSPRSPW